MNTGVYIISAPSGSGKTTLVERLLREVPRLQDAGREIFGYVRYDYVLINDQLDQSAAGLRAIVLWERWRRGSAVPQSLPSSAESVNPDEGRRVGGGWRGGGGRG